jgi:hypothetical protein
MNKLAFFLLLTLFNMPVHAINWGVVVEGINMLFNAIEAMQVVDNKLQNNQQDILLKDISKKLSELKPASSNPKELEDIKQLIKILQTSIDSIKTNPSLENKIALHDKYFVQILDILKRNEQQLPKDNPVLKTLQNNMQVSISYKYRPKHQDELKDLINGSVLKDGDHYKIVFTPQSNGFIYIFQTDSAGKVYQLFPLKNATIHQTNPVQANKTYFLPAEKKSFYLDQQQGEEKIYFIASSQADPELEQSPTIVALQTRGVGGISDDPVSTLKHQIIDDDGTIFHVTPKKLAGWCGGQKGCVNVLTFKHE